MNEKQVGKNKEKFAELYQSLVAVSSEIDSMLAVADIPNNHKKERLVAIEDAACEAAAKRLGRAKSTVKGHWQVMTLPIPVYDALERGAITFTQAKMISSSITMDPESDHCIAACERIVGVMEIGADKEATQEAINKEIKTAWCPSTAVMEMMLSQIRKIA